MAIVIGAGIAAVGTVAGSAISSSGAKDAANAQVTAANNADQTQLQMYNQTRTDQTPWRNAGGQAISALSSWYGLPTTNADGTTAPGNPNAGAADTSLIESLPGYQFNLQQGQQATERNLAANGMLGSGAAQKALTQYGQGYAQNAAATSYLNGLQSLAGIGQTSVQATGAAGTNAANQIGSNQIYAGNAQASGYANQANAVNSGLSGLSGIFGNYAQQQQYGGGGGSGYSPYSPSYAGQSYSNISPGASQGYIVPDYTGGP
jgi:hypothetical protein